MKAIGYTQAHLLNASQGLQDITLPDPVPTGHDLLVEVHAVSMNPVDAKVRASSSAAAGEDFKVLGYDASGVVRAVGPEVTLFRPGDRVYYAGAIQRPGTNSELHLVDERIVGHMPKSLGFAQAAALPLTSITAWELLFDRLGVVPGKKPGGKSLLVIGAAGGVGSILVQLARRLTGLTIIGTASRPETQAWVKELGAHHVIDHSQPLTKGLAAIGMPQVEMVISLTHTEDHLADILEVLAPQGQFALIDDMPTLDVMPFKRKALSVHWEMMFTRPLYNTPDMIAQHHMLNEVAQMVDAGLVRTTLAEHYGTINAANAQRAHALVESGTARGKVVLEGWGN
ncbi:zinc-binding alcohol dehydrogenase family protein [Rhodoferax aquaticus]|uniref:Zinc-type alcohol dehydrogenase-like protein n=1 Tax=Rhodoferax aquaticus TaxID=2527691 RepID=A0A515EPB0_9BURK|nr:zinc-binding alcohol dehydrogenase family protein [Rhodoferax aquaticus]QDL54460.1 zinc-binding alcohol dehydrogenase family protein [Rhodoferax aquaticus]